VLATTAAQLQIIGKPDKKLSKVLRIEQITNSVTPQREHPPKDPSNTDLTVAISQHPDLERIAPKHLHQRPRADSGFPRPAMVFSQGPNLSAPINEEGPPANP